MSHKVYITNKQNTVKVPSGLRILIRRSCHAVLVFSIGCAVCGAVLFWDVAAFRRMFAFFAARPLLAVLLAASLAVAWQFIFGKRKEGK